MFQKLLATNHYRFRDYMSRPVFDRAEVLVSSPTKLKQKPCVKLEPRSHRRARFYFYDSGYVRVFGEKHDILSQSCVLTYKVTFYITCLNRIDNFRQTFSILFAMILVSIL